MTANVAEVIATAVLTAIAADEDRTIAFLAETGIDPAAIRRVGQSPAFLSGVLDFVMADEPLLLAIAGEIGVPVEQISAAHQALRPREPNWT